MDFNKTVDMYLKRLEQYVPVVDRVHGDHHPEFHNVRKVFTDLDTKLKKSNLNLDDEFIKLKEITNNYQVPSDVCETFEAVYNMLEELDKAYFSK